MKNGWYGYYWLIVVFGCVACVRSGDSDPVNPFEDFIQIEHFSFEGDSVKTSPQKPHTPVGLKLKYQSKGRSKLTANFYFSKGEGMITHPLFKGIRRIGKNITCQVPESFDSELFREIYFYPDRPGDVQVTLELSGSGVKKSSFTSTRIVLSAQLQANFSYSYDPNIKKIPVHVNFDASKSIPSEGGTIEAYIWNLGDGKMDTTTTRPVCEYTYAHGGLYKVSLTVRDHQQKTDHIIRKVLLPDYRLPVAELTVVPRVDRYSLSRRIDPSGSYDPQGEGLNYKIYINGRQRAQSSKPFSYTFKRPRKRTEPYDITLEVESRISQRKASKTVKVIAYNSTPEVRVRCMNCVNGRIVIGPNQPSVTAKFRAIAKDADNDPIVKYKWRINRKPILQAQNKKRCTYKVDRSMKAVRVRVRVADKWGKNLEGENFVTRRFPVVVK